MTEKTAEDPEREVRNKAHVLAEELRNMADALAEKMGELAELDYTCDVSFSVLKMNYINFNKPVPEAYVAEVTIKREEYL